jgi:hypothetical protein
MYTPAKSKESKEEEGLTSTESNPNKIREIFKCPLDMIVMEEVKYDGSARIVAENVSKYLPSHADFSFHLFA